MGIKIFSSFDTGFKQYLLDREIKQFGKDKVYVVSHGKFYYYFYIILPISFVLFGSTLYFIVLYYILSSLSQETKTIFLWFGIVLWLVIFVPIIIKLIKKYIDYILDFVIVTPEKLIFYNQEGIFSRRGRTVDVDKIKTITVNKNGLLRSLFNFGNIVILTEGDEQGSGEINFSFIDDPDNVKFKIYDIIEKE